MVGTLSGVPIQWSDTVFLLGVTGGIASGKSAFCRFLQEAGAVLLDADEQAREALDSAGLRFRLNSLFGEVVAPEDGPVNRPRIAALVFSDPGRRRGLEELIHPEVRARFQAARAALSAGQILAYDVPLLYEAHLADDFDLVIVITAPRAMRALRAQQRNGWSGSEFAARERAQLPLEEKEKMADLVFRNDGPEQLLRDLAVELLERIRRAYPGSAGL